MLTLIEGSLTSLAEAELQKKIKASVASKRRTYLFVPEHETVTCETEMCSLLPPDAPLTFEVTNFTRFVNTSFRAFGGITGKYCDKATSALIMWRTLTELSPMLYMTEKSRGVNEGTVARALAMVKEMEALAITPSELLKLNSGDGDFGGRLKRKLSDLSLVYSLYKKTLTESYADMSEDMERAAELIRKNREYLSDTDVYIDGFTSFTEPQYRLIEALIESSSVTVLLGLPKHLDKRHEYKEIKNTETRLKMAADVLSVEKHVLKPDAPDPERSTVISAISEQLWSVTGEIDNDYLQTLDEDGGRVRIFSAKTPHEECSFIADDIKRRVISGERYSDFAIIAGDVNRYSGIVDRALSDAGIPYYLSGAKSTVGHEAVKLIRTAYRIIRRNFAREDVITYMKSGLVGIPKEEGDECELYIEKWGIDGSRFTDPDGWKMNPRGYEAMIEDAFCQLERLERVREALVSPLVAFRDDTRRASCVKEQAEALFRFMEAIKLEDGLFRRAELLFSLGEGERAEENAKIFGIIISALDKLVELSGDMKSDSESFEGQLFVVLASELVGILPSHIDEVTIGSADMLRVKGKSHVYLIGTNEGVFPLSPESRSYFTDADKEKLSSLGLPIKPTRDTDGSRSLYSFTRAFTFGRKTVTLTYPERDASLSPILPSGVIERIKELTRGKVSVRKTSSVSAAEGLYSASFAYRHIFRESEGCREDIKAALSASGHEREATLSESSLANSGLLLGREAIGIIYKGDLYLSQSRLEAYLDCPFAYFLKYNLKLGEQERAELRANVIGSFIHCILEEFFREVKTKNLKISELSSDAKIKLTEKSSARFIKEQLGEGYGEARTKIAISRLSRSALPVIEGLVDEFSACKYEPTFFELSTDGKSEGSASPVIYEREDGRKIILRGKVDRTDTLKMGDDVYVRVIDYKTGSKSFSPSDLAEGRNLQMFLYLKSIVETTDAKFRELIGAQSGELIPAGVIYAKASINAPTIRGYNEKDALTAAKNTAEREGMLLDDEASLSAMNPAFTPLAYPETSRNAGANAKKKYTREGWADICATIESAVIGISEKMTSGKIPAEPKINGRKSACDWCSFRAVCRNPKN